MDEGVREPRVGVFRREAVDHLAEVHQLAGGVVPRVVPHLGWTIASVSASAAILVGSLMLMQVEDAVAGKAVIDPRMLSEGWPGTRVTATFSGPDRDALQPGMPAIVRFDRPGAQVPAVVESVSDRAVVEGSGYWYGVTVRLTGSPAMTITTREQPVTVLVVTRKRPALAALLRSGR